LTDKRPRVRSLEFRHGEDDAQSDAEPDDIVVQKAAAELGVSEQGLRAALARYAQSDAKPEPFSGRAEHGQSDATPLLDARRHKLCADLRQVYRYINNDEINELIWQAADEIERLAHIVREARKLLGENFERETTDEHVRADRKPAG
jgi:hypothetical protein